MSRKYNHYSIKSSICYCLISANYIIYYFQNKNVPQKSNEKCYIEQNEIHKITNNGPYVRYAYQNIYFYLVLTTITI